MAQEETYEKEIKITQQCNWVMEEFSQNNFGDKRLSLRLLVVAKHLASYPSAPLNQASEIWKKTKAMYRFFDNNKVTADQIRSHHIIKTIQRITAHSGYVICAQDTCFLNFSHMKESEDLGPIGVLSKSCMGLVMHSSLACTEYGVPLGVLSQKIWARDVEEYGKSEKRQELPIEEKESFKWLEALQEYSPSFSSNKKFITVCDREADIYEFFVEAEKLQANLLVRACYDRRVKLEEGFGKLREFMNGKEVVYACTIDVPRENRKAKLEVRTSYVEIPCPDKKKSSFLNHKTIKLYAIYVTEVDAPEDCESLEWMLLTNLAGSHKIKPQRYVRWYKTRWQIEVWHKVLKSGCTVEKIRLEKNERRTPCISLYSIIAWKILQIVHLARVDLTAKAQTILTSTECDALYSVIHEQPVQETTFTAQKAVQWLAQLGGHLARAKDPPPGPTHTWRGWQRLQDFTKMHVINQKRTYG